MSPCSNNGVVPWIFKAEPTQGKIDTIIPVGLQLIPIEDDAVPSKNGLPERTLVEVLALSLGLKV